MKKTIKATKVETMKLADFKLELEKGSSSSEATDIRFHRPFNTGTGVLVTYTEKRHIPHCSSILTNRVAYFDDQGDCKWNMMAT